MGVLGRSQHRRPAGSRSAPRFQGRRHGGAPAFPSALALLEAMRLPQTPRRRRSVHPVALPSPPAVPPFPLLWRHALTFDLVSAPSASSHHETTRRPTPRATASCTAPSRAVRAAPASRASPPRPPPTHFKPPQTSPHLLTLFHPLPGTRRPPRARAPSLQARRPDQRRDAPPSGARHPHRLREPWAPIPWRLPAASRRRRARCALRARPAGRSPGLNHAPAPPASPRPHLSSPLTPGAANPVSGANIPPKPFLTTTSPHSTPPAGARPRRRRVRPRGGAGAGDRVGSLPA